MTTPPPIHPLTAEELAALRRTHVAEEWQSLDLNWSRCPTCMCDWPCTIARLLALVDQERAYRREVAQELIEAAQDSIALRAAIDERLAQRRALG